MGNVVVQIASGHAFARMQDKIKQHISGNISIFGGRGFQYLLSTSTRNKILMTVTLQEFHQAIHKAVTSSENVHVFILKHDHELVFPVVHDGKDEFVKLDRDLEFNKLKKQMHLIREEKEYVVFKINR
jgi:hypothetical protein